MLAGKISTFKSSRMAVSSPYVIDLLRTATISCPNSIFQTDNLYCNVTFVAGTNLQAVVNYGDGNNETCNLMG